MLEHSSFHSKDISSHSKDLSSFSDESEQGLRADSALISLFRLSTELEALALKVNPWLRKQSGDPEGREFKPDGSQVTACDREMERLFRATCERVLKFPYVFLGEEAEEIAQTHEEKVASAKFVVVCDPIDGTTNFIEGNGLYGCLLGIVEQKENARYSPVFGAVFLPEQERLYITEGEDVIALNIATGERAKLLRHEATPTEKFKLSAYPPHKPFFVDGAFEGDQIERVTTNASIMDIEKLIKGEIHASVISGKWWDVAALMAVTEKLGFEALSLRDGRSGYDMALDQFQLKERERRWGMTEPFLIHDKKDQQKLLQLFHFKPVSL
jgi:fructose-1,6-bisphosphatase/inositol monophosphatase family enzyme